MKQPGKNVLRVGGGNVYVNNPDPAHAVAVAVGTRSHSFGFSEGANLGPHLRGLSGHDELLSFGSDDRRDSDDCAMIVRKSLDVIHHSMSRVCRDVPGTRVGHARVFSAIGYEAPFLGRPTDEVLHIAIHPNWVVGFDSTNNAIVREYVKSMKALRALLTLAKSLGWLTAVSGDFNTEQGDEKSFETVYDVFRDFRMGVEVEGIDGIAWDRRLKLADWHRIPGARVRTDHAWWTVADLVRR